MADRGVASAGGRPADHSWRPQLFARVAFAVLGVSLIGFALLFLIAAVDEPGALVLVPVLAAPGIGFLLALRMRITVSADYLEYRNLGAVARFRWQEIRGAEAGYSGITLMLDGEDEFRQPRTAVAMAVQKSNLATWFGWTTRADRLVGVIGDRAGGTSDGHGAPPAV